MITTIISNNCTGGAVCHELGMELIDKRFVTKKDKKG